MPIYIRAVKIPHDDDDAIVFGNQVGLRIIAFTIGWWSVDIAESLYLLSLSFQFEPYESRVIPFCGIDLWI